jgi:hypothetical protein
MKISRLMALALAPLLLTACEEQAEETGEMAESIAAAPDANAGQEFALDTVGEEGMQAAFALNELNGSGVTGEATLAPAGTDRSSVTITLNSPADDGATHQGHIHTGRCDAMGTVVVPLPPVMISGGTGTATSTVAVDAMTVMDDGHIVLYHEAGGQPGRPLVCGEIPGHVM